MSSPDANAAFSEPALSNAARLIPAPFAAMQPTRASSPSRGGRSGVKRSGPQVAASKSGTVAKIESTTLGSGEGSGEGDSSGPNDGAIVAGTPTVGAAVSATPGVSLGAV